MFKCARVFLGVTWLGSMVACGAADDGNTKRFRSTLQESKVLSSIPEEEAMQFCSELGDWEAKRLKDEQANLCRSGGWWAAQIANTTYPPLPLADIKETCRKTVAACLQIPSFQPAIDCTGIPVEEDEAPPPSFSDSCQVTIAQAESCHNEAFEGYLASLDSAPSCDDITGELLVKKPFGSDDEATIAQGPACRTMQDNCPDAYIAGP
jgi:hypothetical protein